MVQFDGLFLHVWHLSEPFHRVTTCDRFEIVLSDNKLEHCIRLGSGARVETMDAGALMRLAREKNPFLERRLGYSRSKCLFIAVIVLSACFVCRLILATEMF